jgi:rhomboid protease GluP
MAFGFLPKHVQEYNLDNLDKEQFLVFAIEAATKLDWNVSFVSETEFIAYTNFSWSSWSEEITIKIDNGIASVKSVCAGAQIVDWGKNKRNVKEFISTIEEVKKELTQAEIESKIVEMRQSTVSKENDILDKTSHSASGKMTNFFSIFVPTKGYFVTPILININILIFIAMIISGVHIFLPDIQSLVDWGANFRPITIAGQWWRLFTATFLHIGILHLLLNMYALFYIGLLLEPYLGKARFLVAYLISGITASAISLWWNDLTVSAGASGAIFGMYGVFLALLTTNLLDKSARKALLTSIAVFVGYNILNGLKPGSGIDNAAHIGGLVSGLIIGYAFVPSLKEHDNSTIKSFTIKVLLGFFLIFSFATYKFVQNNPGDSMRNIEIWESKINNQFVMFEREALRVYRLPPTAPKERALFELKDGIGLWNELLKLIESFNDLKLPPGIVERNRKLKEYTELRIKSFELMHKAVIEDSGMFVGEINFGKYTDEINRYNNQIETILQQLTEQ